MAHPLPIPREPRVAMPHATPVDHRVEVLPDIPYGPRLLPSQGTGAAAYRA